MSKTKQKILGSINTDQLERELNRLGEKTFSHYSFKHTRQPVVYTIHEALTQLFVDAIKDSNEADRRENLPYTDLTAWEFLEEGELLIVYDVERNAGRMPTAKEYEEYLGNDHSLTPAAIRKWYLNRKVASECLLSDFEGVTLWIPE